MRLKAEQLESALEQSLQPVYLIYGDELLLVEEAADSVRQRVRLAGANDREVWHVEGRFDWSQIKWQEQSLSLFASQRLIEIRLPSGSPGKDGGEALRQFATDPPQDTTVLIISGKIDSRSQKAKWFTELDRVGATVPIWPVDITQLPRWIMQRMRNKGLRADLSLATLIAERVEGNLFAAAQDIDKLSLLSNGDELTEAMVLEAIADNARFDAFGLMDTVLSGQPAKIPRIIERLQAEGIEILAILSAVGWTLRRVVDMSVELQHGQPIERVMAAQKPPVWDKQKTMVRHALQRYDSQRWQQFLSQMAEIDQAAKGLSRACPWQLLQRLCLQAAGVSRA
jgi:DNA polymerase-3 subunit delta